MLPVITVNSSCSGLLLVNGALAGEVSPEQWVSLPIGGNGRCYLHLLPDGPGYTQTALALKRTEDGGFEPTVNPPPARIAQWPSGVTEITMTPTYFSPPPPLPLAPDFLGRLEVGDYTASLLSYGCLWVVVEDDQGNTVYSQALPAEAKSGAVQELPRCPLTGFLVQGAASTDIPGQVTQWAAAYALENGRWDRQYYLCGQSVEVLNDGTATCAHSLEDSAGHTQITTCRYNGSKFSSSSGLRIASAVSPTTPEGLALAFLEACTLAQFQEAEGYLTPNLRSGLSGEDLRSFIGDINSCGQARYCPPCPPNKVQLAAFHQQPTGVLEALPLIFTFEDAEGRILIDDIQGG